MKHETCEFCKRKIFSQPIRTHPKNKWKYKYTFAHRLCKDRNDRLDLQNRKGV